MGNNSWQRGKEMSAADYVLRAQSWAKQLEEHEAQGGTLESARYRLQMKFGIPVQAFWSLRYRPPKQIAADLYDRLRHACLVQAERSIERSRLNIEALKNYGEDTHAQGDVARLTPRNEELVGALESEKAK
jgi:hypothetical protein